MGKNLFEGLRNAKPSERGVYLDPGTYDLQIEKVILKETRKSGDAFIVEATVLASNNEKHPVGSKRTWYQSLKDKDVGYGAMTLFAYAVLGLDRDADKVKIDKEITPNIEEILSEAVTDQSMKSEKVHVEVTQIKTKEKQSDFNLHVFSPYREKKAA